MSKLHSLTKYNPAWEKDFAFLKPGGNNYTGKCLYCATEFKVDMQGKQQVKSHAKGKKHIEKAKLFQDNESQRRLTVNKNNVVLTPNLNNGCRPNRKYKMLRSFKPFPS